MIRQNELPIDDDTWQRFVYALDDIYKLHKRYKVGNKIPIEQILKVFARIEQRNSNDEKTVIQIINLFK